MTKIQREVLKQAKNDALGERYEGNYTTPSKKPESYVWFVEFCMEDYAELKQAFFELTYLSEEK